MNIKKEKDFREELYSKYVSTFKKYIGDESSLNINSQYELYKRWYLPLLKGFNNNSAIIDIGCGTGLMLQFLRQNGYNNLYGIDISQQQVDKTKEKGLSADVYNIFDFLNNNSKKFDIIFAMDIVEHFYKEELFNFFSGMFNILNENGIIIIHTPNGDGLFSRHAIYGDLTHLTIFNSNSISQILRLSGFEEIKCYETGPTSKNLKGIIRLILWKFIKVIFKAIRTIETGGSEKVITQDFICTAKKLKSNCK